LQFIGSEANAAKGACSAPEPAGVSLGDGAIHFELGQMPATPVFVKKDTLQSGVDDQACFGYATYQELTSRISFSCVCIVADQKNC